MVLLARPSRRLLTARSPIQWRYHGVRRINTDIAHNIAVVPITFLEMLHSTGLPWFAVLPISAVLIRSFFIYPLFQKPLRKSQVDRAQMQPMIESHVGHIVRSGSISPSSTANKVSLWLAGASYRRNLQKEFFDRRFFPYRVATVATTIAVSDGMRRLMGAREGLLKTLLGPFDWTLSWLLPNEAEPDKNGLKSSPEIAASSNPNDPSTSVVQDVAASAIKQDTASTSAIAQDAVSASPAEAAVSTVADNVNSPWFDPSMMTEGFSWCQDLTVSDPTLVLPVMFSSVFFANFYFGPRIAGASTTAAGQAPKATNAQRIGMTIAMLSIFPALKMPAGLLLYFIANILTTNLQMRWLAFTKPVHPAPGACKRPIRIQASREMADSFEKRARAKR